MTYPKWMYRKHPELGVFQSTLVASAEAAAGLEPNWSEDPTEHGFEVRPVSQMHPSHHVGDNLVLHEVVSSATEKPVNATIDVTLNGDIANGL